MLIIRHKYDEDYDNMKMIKHISLGYAHGRGCCFQHCQMTAKAQGRRLWY